MKNRDDLEMEVRAMVEMQLREKVGMQLREKGKWVKGKALTLATLLLKHGAEPTRLLAREFDYSGQMVRIPAEAADYMVALLLYVTPRCRGGRLKESTLYARILMAAGMSQRQAAGIVAKKTGESAVNIRPRLVVRKKTRSRKPRSSKSGSGKPRSSKPR